MLVVYSIFIRNGEQSFFEVVFVELDMSYFKVRILCVTVLTFPLESHEKPFLLKVFVPLGKGWSDGCSHDYREL